MLTRLRQVETSLGLSDEGCLAQYLRVSVDDIRRFKADPEGHPLPSAGQRALGVAWRYLMVSNVVLCILPDRVRASARRWEQARARLLAHQRAAQR